MSLEVVTRRCLWQRLVLALIDILFDVLLVGDYSKVFLGISLLYQNVRFRDIFFPKESFIWYSIAGT